MSELTHFNQAGEAHMVDIADKDQTHRIGIAEGWISMHPETFALVEKGNAKKGDVLAAAPIAGTYAQNYNLPNLGAAGGSALSPMQERQLRSYDQWSAGACAGKPVRRASLHKRGY